MSENKKQPSEAETILLALDQISQTIDVMTSVVGRLRTYVQNQEDVARSEQTALSQEGRQPDQTLH